MRRQPDKRRIVPKSPRPSPLPVTEKSLQRAEYLTTAAEWRQLPRGNAPEIAFAGRSNAGKSAAINALTQRTRLAFSSKVPGRTRHINFFRFASGALLADLPGYGYAEAPAKVRGRWQLYLGRYLSERPQLAGLVLVLDARRRMTELDRRALDWVLPRLPVHILLSKSDKLTRSEQGRTLEEVCRSVTEDYAGAQIGVQLFSATKRQGVREARAVIASWLARPCQKERPRCQGE